MEQRNFGSCELSASVIGFGTWQLSLRQYGPVDVAQAKRAVHAAIDHGITLFDTSETYGPFTSERLLGEALGPRRQDITLVTKVGFTFRDDPDHPGYQKTHERDSSARNIIAHAEGCLRRLKTDVIDLLLLHWHDHKTPHEDTIAGLQALKDAGKIRHYGVSNYNRPMLSESIKHGRLTANQVGYHLFDRRVEASVLPYCREQGIGFMAYGTLAFGLLSGAFTPDTRFVDWDWRSRGDAFRPAIIRAPSLPPCFACGGAAQSAGGRSRQVCRPTGHRLAARATGRDRRPGRHAQRARAKRECGGGGLAPVR